MLCIQKCDMHLFQAADQKESIAYQVETGLFFKLDTLFQSILECCEGLSVSQVVQAIGWSIRGRGNCRGYRGIGSGGFDFGWCFTPGIQCADNRRGGSLWGHRRQIVCRCRCMFRIRVIFSVLIALPTAGIMAVRRC